MLFSRPTVASPGSTQSSSTRPAAPQAKPVDSSETSQLIDLFPDQDQYRIHHHDICSKMGCTHLSPNDTMKTNRQNKRRKYFSHSWLFDIEMAYCRKTGMWWLVYQENKGMFCLLCKKHHLVNARNKSDKYCCKPAVRFCRRGVLEHANAEKHKINAVEAELTSRVSLFEKIYQEKASTRYSTICNAVLSAYWLAKEELPNKKLYSLKGLLQKAGVDKMKYFQYSSEGTAREIFLILGEVLREDVVARVKNAQCYGILTCHICSVCAGQ